MADSSPALRPRLQNLLPVESQEDVVFEEKTHPNKMLEGLDLLRLKQAFCDVVLCCGEQEFPCHRNVLASFSSYFQAMFECDWVESRQSRVSINGVEPEAIGLLVQYAYTAKVLISPTNVQGLLTASNLLNITPVQQSCCEFMERNMDEKNCLGIHCLAEAHCCSLLEKRSKDFILEHFTVVYQQEELLLLSVDKLTEILSDDDLNVSKEEMVFEAAVRWLKKCPTRNHSFEKVLEHVRLPLISPSYLRDVIECEEVVKHSQGCQRLLSEAKDHRPRPRTSTVTEVMVTVGGQENKDMLHSVESFEPSSNQWKTLRSLPFAVRRHCVVVSGSTLYLAGGELADGSVSREMWRYDPSTDIWTEMSSMNEARCDFGLVVLDRCLYAVGGRSLQSRMERYNLNANVWTFVQSVGVACFCDSPAVVALDGFLYHIGGSVMTDGYRTDVSQVFRFDPRRKPLPAWTQVAPMNVARFGAAACTLHGKIYVIGGWHSTQSTEHVESYDPQTDQWTLCSSMKRRRCHPGVAVVDGNIYVLGGKEGFLSRYHQSMERYSKDGDMWDMVGDMPSARSWFSCVSVRLRRDGQTVRDSDTLRRDGHGVSDGDTGGVSETPEDADPPVRRDGHGGVLEAPGRRDGPLGVLEAPGRREGPLWVLEAPGEEAPGRREGPLGVLEPPGRREGPLGVLEDDWRFWELNPVAEMRMWRRRWRARRRMDLDN